MNKKRFCRSCKTLLPVERYFECFTCKPELPSIDDDFIYMGSDSIDFFGDASDEWEELDVSELSDGGEDV